MADVSANTVPSRGGAPAMEDKVTRLDMFMLEMKVQGFFTKDFSGKKVYRKGVVINWEVELGAITVDMLMKVLAAELKWAPNQSAKLWFFDRNFGEDVRLVDDSHLIQMFQMYKSEMFCQILVEVFDISVRTEDEYDLLEPICAITPDGSPFLNNYPPTTYEPTNELTEQPTDFPYANLDSSTQPRTNDASQEPNIEPDREPDIFECKRCGDFGHFAKTLSLEGKATKKKVKCKRCGDFGHFAKTCKLAEHDSDGEIGGNSKNKRKRQEDDDMPGTSQKKKKGQAKKKSPKKKKTQKKKKTPLKKKEKQAAAAPQLLNYQI